MRETRKRSYRRLSVELKLPAVFRQTGTISVENRRLHSGSLQAVPLYMQIHETSFIRTEDKGLRDRRSYVRILGSCENKI